jgi:hypothetical protein
MNFAAGMLSFPRPGTAAARYPHQVSSCSKERNAMLRSTAETAGKFRDGFVGQTCQFCGKIPAGWPGWLEDGGLTDNYLRVCAVSPEKKWNEITLVEIKPLQGMACWVKSSPKLHCWIVSSKWTPNATIRLTLSSIPGLILTRSPRSTIVGRLKQTSEIPYWLWIRLKRSDRALVTRSSQRSSSGR